jgi:predicted metal-dependent phosphoesterase TrpH
VSERFDLHVHSSVSDGTVPPARLVSRAARLGVAGLALTDHDTLAGVEEALAEGETTGVEVLAGIEISVSENDGARQVHILGFGTDHPSPKLRRRLEELRVERLERGLRMLERLRGLGIDLPDRLVHEVGGRGSVGRPHIAEALVRARVCSTPQEAFDRFIGHRGPAYVPRAGMTTAEAIDVIHGAGGIAVLAHPPLSVGIDRPGGLDALAGELKRGGLDGLEVWHPGHSPRQRRRLAAIARAHGLLPTGGSDFHGTHRPDIEIGRGRGNISVSAETFRGVVERIRERRSGSGRGKGSSLTGPGAGGNLRPPL